jgi:hypothetical protein
MEPNDNSCIRVILHPDQGHTVLDAQSSCGGYPFPLSRVNLSWTTPEQHRPSQSGVERFGPNQVVGVPAFGDPLEHLSINRVFLPETRHSCLSLPYILHSSLSIGYLRVLSLPGTFSHKSSAAGGRNIVFATGGRYSNITGRVHPLTWLPKNGTHTAGSCLTGPLIVNGPFKTIAFNSRFGRMLNRRNIRISLFGVGLLAFLHGHVRSRTPSALGPQGCSGLSVRGPHSPTSGQHRAFACAFCWGM